MKNSFTEKSSKMKTIRFFFAKRFLGYLGIFFLLQLSIVSKGQSNLPPEFNNIFFQMSKFNHPIWIEVPPESSLTHYQNISQSPDVYETGLPQATIEIGKGLKDYDKHLLSFLVETGYAKIETKTQTTHNNRYGNRSKTYHFLFYTDDFKKKIQYFRVEDFYGEITLKPFVQLAHRQLLSVDYQNQYEDAPFGMRRTFYAITFSYKLVNDLPELPEINQVFKGKGKIFKDPDDGAWKTDGPFENLGIELSDKGYQGFINLLKSIYKPFNFENNLIKPNIDVNRSNTVPDNPATPEYEGEYKDGKKHGQGKMIYENGNIYEGEWKDDKKNGQGKMVYKDGSSYEGEWKDDRIEGFGTVIWKNGRKYVGFLVKDQKHGKGTTYHEDETIEYEGDYENGKRHGHGTTNRISDDGTKVSHTGEYFEGKIHGQGTTSLIFQNGKSVTFSGEYKEDKFYNGTLTKVEPDGTRYISVYKNGKAGKEKKV
jgi:hypothetical protein